MKWKSKDSPVNKGFWAEQPERKLLLTVLKEPIIIEFL